MLSEEVENLSSRHSGWAFPKRIATGLAYGSGSQASISGSVTGRNSGLATRSVRNFQTLTKDTQRFQILEPSVIGGSYSISKKGVGAITWKSVEAKIESFYQPEGGLAGLVGIRVTMAGKVMSMELCERLEQEGVLAAAVHLTGDADILVTTAIGGVAADWQIDSDGDIAVMINQKFGEPRFYDLSLSDVSGLVRSVRNGAGRS